MKRHKQKKLRIKITVIMQKKTQTPPMIQKNQNNHRTTYHNKKIYASYTKNNPRNNSEVT